LIRHFLSFAFLYVFAIDARLRWLLFAASHSLARSFAAYLPQFILFLIYFSLRFSPFFSLSPPSSLIDTPITMALLFA